MLKLGFSSKCGHDGSMCRHGVEWRLNPANRAGTLPRLTWRQGPDGLHYLTGEVSLPKMALRSNVEMLTTDTDIEDALSTMSYSISESARVDFDSANANVGRVDYCYNWRLRDPSHVYAYLDVLQGGSVPRMTRRIIGKTTVEFFNDSQTVTAYSKLDETISRLRDAKATGEEVVAAIGVLRLEKRYRDSGACRRLAHRLALPDRRACSLLNTTVANLVLEATTRDLGLDMSIDSGDVREARLRQFYGPGPRYLQLLGFIAACDALGAENLVTLGVCSRAAYYAKKRAVKRAGAWLVNRDKRKLPPLRLVRQDDQRTTRQPVHLAS